MIGPWCPAKPGSIHVHGLPGGLLRTQFRFDINALRALAVVMVIANHLNNNAFPGGYLGVDIFFAISGFVIYQSIHQRSVADGYVDIPGFYARRILRLFPALVFFVVVVSALVAIFDPDPGNSIDTGLFSIFGLSNLYLYHQDVDYFAPSITSNAFMHTWSLGVEEQFYIFLSLLAVFWARMKPGKQTFLFAAAGALSFLYWLYLTIAGDVSSAYFFSPARFWEVMAGVVVARLCITKTFTANRFAFHAVLLGLVALAFAPESLDFLFKPLAIALTCFVLATGSGFNDSRILATRPLQFFGDISYSLYLWHWPVICLSVYMFGFASVSAGWLVAVMLAASVFSYYVIEKPFRKYRYRGKLAVVFSTTLLAAAAGFSAVMYLGRHSEQLLVESDVQYQFPASADRYGDAQIDFFGNCAIDGVRRLLKEDTFSKCTLPPKAAGLPTFWAEGDSHAGHHSSGLAALRNEYGFGVHDIETVGVSFPAVSLHSPSREEIHRRIMQAARPGDVIVIARLYFDRPRMSPTRELNAWVKLVDSFLATARKRDLKVVIMGPSPVFEFANIRTCRPRGLHKSSCDIEREGLAKAIAPINAVLADVAARHEDVKFIDQFDLLCPPASTSCSPFEEGVALYRDKDHLNSQGSRKVFGAISSGLLDFSRNGSPVTRVGTAVAVVEPVAAPGRLPVAQAGPRPGVLRQGEVSIAIALDGEIKVDAARRVIGIPVKISNKGTVALSGKSNPPVNIGVQLLAADGTYTSKGGVRDFHRTPSPAIEPGASASILLAIPMRDDMIGRKVRVDMVQESVSWFSRWGQPTLEVGPLEFEPARTQAN